MTHVEIKLSDQQRDAVEHALHEGIDAAVQALTQSFPGLGPLVIRRILEQGFHTVHYDGKGLTIDSSQLFKE